jgi:MSHA biogenesis protein MshL
MVATLALPLGSCTFLDSFVPKKGESTDVIDRQQNLTINDFKDLSAIDKKAAEANAAQEPNISAALGAPPIPDFAEVLAAPQPPKVANTKLVTLAVTDDVPLRDVLFELGRLANVDIEVGPGLDSTGINLRATNRPFNEVIERIATLGNLRYSVNGSSIRVERDLPYLKNYSLDFLNVVRSSTSGYNVSTNVVSGGGGGGSSGSSSSSSSSSGGSRGGASSGFGSSGSNSSISAAADSDLWSSLEASVNEILAYTPTSDGASGGGASGASGVTGASGGTAAGGGSATINRQAGVLAVNGTERQHEMVQRFLTLMTRNASAQVLIEAKIVEVSLKDQFASGVDWNRVIGNVNSTRLGIGSYVPPNPSGSSTPLTNQLGNPALTFGVDGGDLGAVLALTQVYGTTRTLSSPRLSAINNQQAVLTFAQNYVYFNCTFTPATTTAAVGTGTTNSGTEATLNCDQQTVPIGIIMTILPSINLDTQEVTLSVRPTLTRVAGTETNPQTSFLRSRLPATTTGDPTQIIPNITVPVIESREIDSITKIKSGGVMVIGGLMQDESRNQEQGVPGVSELPIFGNLFKSRSEDSTKRELIIFIKATIVNSDGSSHATDKKVYEKFVTDPRPLYGK